MSFQPNSSQKAFIEAPPGNIRLLAPAGCGKTLCLLHRCKYLAEQSQSRSTRFLIVAFTRAAAEELRDRIHNDSAFASIRNTTDITTLNAWGFRRIKNTRYRPKLLTSRQDYYFAVQNQLRPVWSRYLEVKAAVERGGSNPRVLMNIIDAFKSMAFNHKECRNYDTFEQHWNELIEQRLAAWLGNQIHELKKMNILPDSALSSGNLQARHVYNSFFRFYRDATTHLADENTITFEDQKYLTWLEELENIEQGNYLSGAVAYNHVIVDEFQDINPLDLALIKAIVERNRATLTIAGDDDQAIFEWRGATPVYILKPDDFYSTDFTTRLLSTNYRSPGNIIAASQQLIKHNQSRVDKQIYPGPSNPDDAEIEVWTTEDVNDALSLVCEIVEETLSRKETVALIGRKRSQIIPYQIFFASQGIHFGAAEDLQIFLSTAFEKVIHLLDIKSNFRNRRREAQVIEDVLDLCDLVKRYPLNKTDKTSLENHLRGTGVYTTDAMIANVRSYRGSLKGKNTHGRMSIDFADALLAFGSAESVSDTLDVLSEKYQGLHIDFGKAEDDIFFTDPPFAHLAEYAERYADDIFTFCTDIEIAKETLVHLPPFEQEEDSDADIFHRPVNLMTALRAKGKEFDTVVLLGVNDGIWPHKNAIDPEEKEAERRVFYVAFTRAKKRLIMLVDEKNSWSPYINECGWPGINATTAAIRGG